MAFEITSDDRGLVPILMCFECNQPIKDLSAGTVMWLPSEPIEDDEYGDLGTSDQSAVFLHKGECSRSFDAVHRAVGNHLHCMEIGQFFEAWFQGAQFSSYDRAAAQRRLEMMRDLEDA
jgi:hypothetical protein